MAYDELLAERMRKVLKAYRGVDEKKMFGGVAFMMKGKMFVGIVKNDLMVRVGKERNDEALARPHARPMDFSGRPMKGFIYVSPKGVETEKMLSAWIKMGADFVSAKGEK